MRRSFSTAELRHENTNRIRQVLFSGEVQTKDSLAERTRLSPATCRNILLELLARGEVLELPHGDPHGGRPSHRFRCNNDFVRFAFLRIQYENREKTLTFLLVNAVGEILSADRSPPMDCISADRVLFFLKERMGSVSGIGFLAVSYPGVVLDGKTSCWSDVEELGGQDLQSILQTTFHLPVLIENDVNLAALGYVEEHPIPNLAYIGFPKGNLPGCGLIANGQLLRGVRGFAGEVLYIQNQSWEEQRRRMETRHGMADMVLLFLRSVTALLDPARVVIGAEDLSEADIRMIREKCLCMTRAELLPELIFLPDYLPDNFTGLLSLARRAFFEHC